MAKVTIGLGVLLIALGLGAYLGTGRESVTAMIPAFFGVPMAVLGALALNDGRRKIAMHLAALLALLGLAGSARGLLQLPALLTGGDLERPAAVGVQAAMAVLCLLFLILCVRSFVQARRAAGGSPS